MGMDVSGVKPRSKAGEYVRYNVWHWHPLWDLCGFLAPEITDEVQYAHSNDGDGLDDKKSQLLAAVLHAAINCGAAAEYIAERDAKLAALPDESCWLCQGTGKRPDMVVRNGCNSCEGKGKIRPFSTSYVLVMEDVTEFAAFLRDCGGFEIH